MCTSSKLNVNFIVSGVFFRFIGKAKCSWIELFVRESKPVEGKKETSDSRYYGREEHLAPLKYIVGSKGGKHENISIGVFL